jgi:hypothetical protein
MKISLEASGRQLSATLRDSDVSRQFFAMLPITITMHDLFGREKFGPLGGTLSAPPTVEHAKRYAVGDIVCWTRGPDLAIFHRQDGKSISGVFQVLGRLDQGTEAFARPGPLEVRIHRVLPDVYVDDPKVVSPSLLDDMRAE